MNKFEAHCFIDGLPCQVILIDYELKSIVFKSTACQVSRTFSTLRALGFTIEQLQRKLLNEQRISLARATELGFVIPKSYRADYLELTKNHIEQMVRSQPNILASSISESLALVGIEEELVVQYLAILAWPEKSLNDLIVSSSKIGIQFKPNDSKVTRGFAVQTDVAI